jgi:asparaginyl-tRNA synthetase
MMTNVSEANDSAQIGKEVTLKGWIYRTRSSGSIVFVMLRDSTGLMQLAVNRESVTEEDFENAKKALVESAIEVHGEVVEDKRAPTGYEVRAKSFKVIHFAEPFPIAKDKSVEFLMDKRHLWLRSRHLTSMMKVKATLLRAAREWFDINGFTEVTPPIITSSAAEGGATVFEFEYHGSKAYLSQTAQLYLEAAIFSLEKVWGLTPSFRAEKFHTPRHLAEYLHLEGEEAWVDNEGCMVTCEKLITHMCHRIAQENEEELKVLGRPKEDLERVKTPFKRVTYDEAVGILKVKNLDFKYGDDFGAEEERALTIEEKNPIIVSDYPTAAKPAFYMKAHPDDKDKVSCFDLLAPEGYGELIGASERETDNEILIKRLKEQGAKLESYEWYLDLRKYGSVPHSGFGMGIERVLRWICKLEHIRDATPFPRLINRMYP